jgi:adenylate cyclase
MDQARQVAVLFADVSGSTKLYESEGDEAAMEAIARCIEQMRLTVESSGGRVVKTIGDEVMAAFSTPDAAAYAASSLQHAIDALPPVGTTKLGVRVGFHFGPVIQSDNDIFGDTVNLASRLVEQAARSQIIISRETSDLLGPVFRSFKRPLYAIHVKGKAEEVELCELIWRHADDVTMFTAARANAAPEPLVLRLKYRDREIVRRRDSDSISMGRAPDCDLVIASNRASRKHCTIERRQDKFVLADQSTNGTYVTAEGGAEILLRREEFRLGKHGWITFGQPRAEAEDVVEYFCS